jgi:ATP-dependent Zn protease
MISDPAQLRPGRLDRQGVLPRPDLKTLVAYFELGPRRWCFGSVPIRCAHFTSFAIHRRAHTLQLPVEDRYLITEPKVEIAFSVLPGGCLT